jgi:hypothetical protein
MQVMEDMILVQYIMYVEKNIALAVVLKVGKLLENRKWMLFIQKTDVFWFGWKS